MSRIFSASSAVLLSLLPAIALAAQAPKQHAHRWHGYGFLPGYHQPPNETVPVYGAKGSIRNTPDFTPSYWYNGERYYFGEPALDPQWKKSPTATRMATSTG